MNNLYQNKNVLVLGLAKSGFYAAKLLNELGARVTVNDAKDLSQDVRAKELEKLGIRIISGGHPVDLFEDDYDLMVKNPGIPYENSAVKKALAENLPIITEVELAFKVMKGHFIGITGSNGKTTTTRMIQEMLATNRSEGKAYAIGNIGVAASEVALKTEATDDLIVELSSFQLMGTPTIRPEIAIITNITEAHLDYHGTRENYVAAKLNLIQNQTKEDILIYNEDQAGLKELLQSKSSAQLIPFSIHTYLEEGASIKDHSIYFKKEKIADVSDVFIKGKHNLANFLAAIAVAKIKNISNHQIKKVMREFKGVKHRTQFVVEWEDRVFYNDSKATNIEATEKALAGFSQPVVLLAGGLDRGYDFKELIPSFKKHVKGLIVMGETAERMKCVAKSAGLTNIQEKKEMIAAVETAYQMSRPGDVILLSPAAASWDQYENFEIRGERFIEAIDYLIKKDGN